MNDCTPRGVRPATSLRAHGPNLAPSRPAQDNPRSVKEWAHWRNNTAVERLGWVLLEESGTPVAPGRGF